jgi:hypothetical protein
MNQNMQGRLRFIDFLLTSYGHVNRSAITNFYGLSMAQASLDIRAYMEQAPGNVEYDKTMKTYRVTARYKRVFK